MRWRRADACDPQEMTQALAGTQVVVHAASAGMSDPGAEITFAQAVVDGARANGLAHVVYVSINNVDRNAFFPLYAAKVGAETVVAESALPYTVQRIAQFHPFVAHVIALLSRGPFAVFPPGAALQPIDVRAAAERLADVALGAPRGRARSLAGPEDLELTTMYAQWKRARGIRKPALTLPIPLPAARALADRRQIDPTAERLGPTWEEWIAANARLPDLYARPHRTS